MNKILNWTFGACFRTLGRFLAIFLVGVLLIFIGSKIGIELPDWLVLNVNATEFEDNWADGLPQLMAIDYLDCTTKGTSSRGNTICTKTVATKSSTFITGTGTRNYAINTNPLTIGSNGYSISTTNPIVAKNGYVYNVNLYGCGNKSIHTTTHDLFFGDNAQDVNKNIKISETLINIWSPPGIQSGNIIDTMTPCFRISSLVVPERDDYGYVTLRLKSSTAISDLDIALISLEVRELGLYTNEIQNIIQNSGFATAESVEEVQNSVNQIEQEIQQTQDTITDEDTSGAEDSASGFFNDFTTETFGLTSIITVPLNAINSLISSSCSTLVLPLPYVDKNLSLPCMSTIYGNYFGAFFSIYQLITTGLISYYVIVRIFNLVKDFKNPDHDEIEVVDL